MSQVEKRRMCPHCRAFITTDDKVCPYCLTQVAPPQSPAARRIPSDVLGGLIPHARFTTMMILLVNTGLYVAMVLYSMRTGGRGGGLDLDLDTLFAFGGKYGPAIRQGDWWRLITAGFLHGGLLHILMNSWVLFDLGVQVEEAFGTARYLMIYFVTTITGFLASMYWAPGVLSIGSSAGIFGLIGAMIAMGVRDRSAYGAAVRSLYMRWAIYALLFGLLPFFATDNAAHIGGVTGGFVIGYLCGTPTYSRTVEMAWKIAAGVAIGITLLAFGNMFLQLLTPVR
jgi:rhomboid protease GluP